MGREAGAGRGSFYPRGGGKKSSNKKERKAVFYRASFDKVQKLSMFEDLKNEDIFFSILKY